MQLGGNLLQLDGARDTLRGGVAYTRGNTRIRPHTADGYSSTTFGSGSVSLYGTWQHDGGFYLYGSLSWGWHRGDSWNASLESGYPLVFANGVRLEPQAQLSWLRLKLDDRTDRDRTTVSFNDSD
nr:outer membrane autotransporter barrel domain-containing protein [Candidatus Pantoea persica]